MALIAVIGSVSWAVIAQATISFNPTADVKLGPVNQLCPSIAGTAGANDCVTTHVTILPPDSYFSSLVTFWPVQWGVARDADVPNGALVAHLASTATLGLLNNPCTATNPVQFELLDATTDKSTSFTYDRVLKPTTGPSWPGYDIMPSGLERAVEQYPAFLDDIPQLAGNKQPIARYFSHGKVSTTEVSLQFLLYEPGVLGPAERGYASVTVLQDPSPGPAAPASVTDNCTKMETNLTVYGTSKDWPAPPATPLVKGGQAVRTNPTCGGPDFTFSWIINSQWDADDDGIENTLDSCPNNPKPAGYDPRTIIDLTDNQPPPFGDGYCDNPPVGDEDCDGIDDSCDKGKTRWDVLPFNDNDSDGFLNRQDNCSVDYNPQNEDSDADGIGDACDSTRNSASGQKLEVTKEDSVKISGADQACSTTGTGTETATATATATATGTAVATATATATATPIGEFCTPMFPGTYNGSVRVSGQPATSGLELTASVGDQEWGSTFVSGGRYILDIPQKLPKSVPCFAGGTLVFKLDGMICTPVQAGGDQWAAGIQDVDLNCAPAATATATSTPAVTGTPKPPTTGTPTGTPTATPAKPPPSGGGGLPGGDAGLPPLWAMILASWVTLMSAAGLGILVAKR